MVTGPAGSIVATGNGFTWTSVGFDEPVHPFASVTVTVYEPVAEDVIDCVVSLVDHRYDIALDAVMVTLSPEQILNGPFDVTVGEGLANCVIVTGVLVEVHPLPFVICTE